MGFGKRIGALEKTERKSWQDLKTNTKPTLTAHVEAEPKHQKHEWTLPAGHLKMGTSSSGCREAQRLPACVQRHNQTIVFRFKSIDVKESERHPQHKPTTVSQKSSPWTTRKEPPSHTRHARQIGCEIIGCGFGLKSLQRLSQVGQYDGAYLDIW